MMDPIAVGVAPLIAVSDLDVSVEFYTRALGATVRLRLQHYALLEAGTQRLHLAVTACPPPDRPQIALAPASTPDSRPFLLVLQVRDCDSAAESIAALGAQVLGPPTVPPWGGERRCFALDPDGHLLELNQALPGA